MAAETTGDIGELILRRVLDVIRGRALRASAVENPVRSVNSDARRIAQRDEDGGVAPGAGRGTGSRESGPRVARGGTPGVAPGVATGVATLGGPEGPGFGVAPFGGVDCVEKGVRKGVPGTISVGPVPGVSVGPGSNRYPFIGAGG